MQLESAIPLTRTEQVRGHFRPDRDWNNKGAISLGIKAVRAGIDRIQEELKPTLTTLKSALEDGTYFTDITVHPKSMGSFDGVDPSTIEITADTGSPERTVLARFIFDI